MPLDAILFLNRNTRWIASIHARRLAKAQTRAKVGLSGALTRGTCTETKVNDVYLEYGSMT